MDNKVDVRSRIDVSNHRAGFIIPALRIRDLGKADFSFSSTSLFDAFLVGIRQVMTTLGSGIVRMIVYQFAASQQGEQQ